MQQGTLTLSNPASDVTFSISGEPVETWVINETPSFLFEDYSVNINFNYFNGTEIVTNITGNTIGGYPFYFGIRNSTTLIANEFDDNGWYSFTDGSWYWDAYGLTSSQKTQLKTITFSSAPTGDLLTWLQANAVKQ